MAQMQGQRRTSTSILAHKHGVQAAHKCKTHCQTSHYVCMHEMCAQVHRMSNARLLNIKKRAKEQLCMQQSHLKHRVNDRGLRRYK